MGSVMEYIEKKLKLRVNRKKSGVRHCSKVRFLGYTIERGGRIRVADESIDRLKRKVIKITKRNRGVKFSQLIGELNKMILGWGTYYRLVNTHLSTIRDIDGQIRRRLRCYRLKQCGRVYSVVKFLRSMGIPVRKCWNAAYYHGWWKMTLNPAISKAMGLRWFADQGLCSLQVVMKRYNI